MRDKRANYWNFQRLFSQRFTIRPGYNPINRYTLFTATPNSKKVKLSRDKFYQTG